MISDVHALHTEVSDVHTEPIDARFFFVTFCSRGDNYVSVDSRERSSHTHAPDRSPTALWGFADKPITVCDL